MDARIKLSYFYEFSLPSRTAASIQILRTARALVDHGFAVDLCIDDAEAPEACLAFYGLTPHPGLRLVPFYKRVGRPSQYPRALANYLAAQDPGCVLMSRGRSGLNLADALRKLPSRDVRLILECHRLMSLPDLGDPPGRNGNALMRWLTRRALRSQEARALGRADAVVCLTPGVEQDLWDHYGWRKKPTLILPSGVEVPCDHGVDPVHKDIDVLYVGKLRARKGVDQFVHALAGLPGRRACIVGGSDEQTRRLESMAVSIGLSPGSLACIGQVEPGRVPSYYRRAKAGVCPLPAGVSRIAQKYTSPMKLLEMMAYRVPIVASDLPTTRAIVENEVSALLVPPGDPAALALALRRILDDQRLAERLSENAWQAVQRYRWDRRACRLGQLLKALERV